MSSITYVCVETLTGAIQYQIKLMLYIGEEAFGTYEFSSIAPFVINKMILPFKNTKGIKSSNCHRKS